MNDEDVPTWDRFSLTIGTRADRDVRLTVVRDGRQQAVTMRAASEGRFEVGDIGVLPDVYPSVHCRRWRGGRRAGGPESRRRHPVHQQSSAWCSPATSWRSISAEPREAD